MKRINTLILFILALYCHSFGISVYGGYVMPLLNNTEIFKEGISLGADVPIFSSGNSKFRIAMFYKNLKTKHFEDLKFNIYTFSPSYEYGIVETFHFSFSGIFRLNLFIEEIKRDMDYVDSFFWGISVSLKASYFYSDKVNLIFEPGLFISEGIYLITFLAGFEVSL